MTRSRYSPIYGLLTNGSNFVFLKLAYQNNIPTYTLSDEFIIHNRENGLYFPHSAGYFGYFLFFIFYNPVIERLTAI